MRGVFQGAKVRFLQFYVRGAGTGIQRATEFAKHLEGQGGSGGWLVRLGWVWVGGGGGLGYPVRRTKLALILGGSCLIRQLHTFLRLIWYGLRSIRPARRQGRIRTGAHGV